MWLLVLVTIGSAACGLVVNPQIFALTGSLCGVFALGVVWPKIAVRGLHCRIRFESARTREGQPVSVRVRITNRWPWPVWGLALEQGFAVFPDSAQLESGESVALSRVGGWATSEFIWSFKPQRRGVYPLTNPTIETGFPFGLVKAHRECLAENELLVWPCSVRLESLPDTFDQSPRENQLTDRKAGDYGDMLGVRPFRVGDSLRRVHWAQTARHGRMIVCERQSAAACAVRIIADLRPEVHSGDGGDSTLEQTIRILASVCESLQAQRAVVECVIGHELFTLGNSEADWRRLMDRLARIPVNGIDETPRVPWRGRSVSQILVTTDTAASAATSMTSAESRSIVVHRESPHQIFSDHAWIGLSSRVEALNGFRDLWVRACHAA
jgi:uncharacterized protein (DUF58 family)